MYYLDANALYWYYGRDKLNMSSSGVDAKKLADFLDTHEDKSIPASVLIEVIVHFRKNPTVLSEIISFIQMKKMRIYNNCPYFSFSPEELTVTAILRNGQIEQYAE